MEYKGQNPILSIFRVVDRLLTKNIKSVTGFKYSFMKEDNLTKLNLAPGAIPPFIGFMNHYQTFIDDSLDEKMFYYGSGGSKFNACKFTVGNYLKLGAESTNLTH